MHLPDTMTTFGSAVSAMMTLSKPSGTMSVIESLVGSVVKKL